MTVHARLYDEGSLRVTENGHEIIELYMVTEVRGNADRRFLDALDASGIPSYGQVHAGIPTISVTQLEVLPQRGDNTKFLVRVTYAQRDNGFGEANGEKYGPTVWTGGSRTEIEETHLDVNGEPMIVQYRGRPQVDKLHAVTGEVTPLPYSVGFFRYAFAHREEVERSLFTITGTRYERDNPERVSAEVQGTINQATWRGYPPETMLLREINFEGDAGAGWSVSYLFAYKPTGWRVVRSLLLGTSLGPQTPYDATLGNGIEEFDIYKQIPFARFEFND